MNAQPRLRSVLKKLTLIGLGIALAVLFLMILEVGLREFSYGYPCGLFLKETFSGREMRVTNPRAGWRFFPGTMARRPLPESFPLKKEENGFRVFVIGESAARGEALADFSFARMLREMLRARFPENRIEVINTGIPAINSWVMVEFVREVLTYKPDLLIIFAGNNEVIGPYGPGTIFTRLKQRLPIQLSIRLSGLRLGQLVKNLAEWAGKGQPGYRENAWKGLEMFMGNRIRSGDEGLKSCAENFRLNYLKMLELAGSAGVQVIPCLVPSNLRDFPPFASLNDPKLVPEEREKWQAGYQAGIEDQVRGRFDQALQKFLACETIDSSHAELQFRLGSCFSMRGDSKEAGRHFLLARENDALHFRTTNEFNEAIAQACQLAGKAAKLPLLDFPAIFAGVSAHSSPGRELLYDHVHLTVEGHYLVARHLFETMVLSGFLPSPKSAEAVAMSPLPLDECLKRLGYAPADLKNHLERTLANVSRPPFTLQMNHTEYLDYFKIGIASLSSAEQKVPPGGEIDIYRGALRGNPDYRELIMRLGLACASHGMMQEALEAYRRAESLNPHDVDLFNNRGTVYLRLSQFPEAIEEFNRALRLTPALVQPHANLGLLYSRLGKTDEALSHFQSAVAIDPEYVPAYVSWGNLLFQKGDLNGARGRYLAALEVASETPEAYLGLGNIFHKQGNLDEACERYLLAIKANASMPEGYFALAGIYAARKQEKAAFESLSKAVLLAPENLQYGKKLALMLATSEDPQVSHPGAAVELAERLCRGTNHADPDLLQVLGVAYAAAGQRNDAEKTLVRGLEISHQKNDAVLEKEFRDLLDQLKSR